MRKQVVKVTAISVDDMLLRKEREYNPSEFANHVKLFAELGNRFYVAEPDELHEYARFFVAKTTARGIRFFSRFNPYSSSLTDNGLCKVYINEDGIVEMELFNGIGYADNTAHNRTILAAMCNKDQELYISNCF